MVGERAGCVVEAEFRECLLPLQGQLLFPVVDVDLIAFFEEVGFVLICQLVCSFRFQVSSSSASFLFTTFRFFYSAIHAVASLPLC